MGKNRKQASLTNVVQYDSNFNLSIGTSTSSSFNSSGSIIAASGFTGSLSGSVFGLGNTVSFSSSVSSDLINLESKSASVDISITNINSVTSSNIARLSNLETKSASVDISITNINSVTASNIARLSNLESKSSSVDISVSSLNTFSASNDNTSLNSKTGSYATTGSNSFYGTQVFSGSVYIANDLVVQGSSSIQYISASSVSIGTNIVQLNTANPSVRFAGLTIIDSGSIGGSGSFLYDSVEDEFIFVHRGNGTNVTSSHFIMGPETYDSLGNETYLTTNILSKGTGKEHLVDSCIFDNGTTTCIKNNLIGTGTACFVSSVTATAITATGLLYANGGESNTLYTGAFLWTPGSYNFFNQKTDHSLVIGTYNANSPVAALTITQAGTSIFSNTVCACILTAPTISAGVPTNSRIVANANQMYGYYDVETNYRWTLGRDVWAGGSGGLAFGAGGTTCYSMIGDPSGYGCTIAFATLVPSGCSGTTYERMRITSGGEVGIGVTPTSGNRFWVKGSSTSGGDTTILAQNSAGTNLFYVLNNGNVIIPTGNVGIGTVSPNYANLVICNAAVNSGNNSALTIGRVTSLPSSAGDYGNIFLFSTDAYAADKGGTISFGSQYGSSGGETRMSGIFGGKENATNGNYSGYLSFYTRLSGNEPAERMRITSGGFFGIAAVTPRAVFDAACGNAHSIISSWQKIATNGTMYNAFDIVMDESSFAGALYVQANGGGVGIQAVYDVIASYDRICVILRNCMNRGQSESLTIPSYFFQAGSKRICIQQNNGAATGMNISAMLVGTSYGGTYICAQG